eukprot:15354773-Ditylum_brightwellii.AAC.1
MLDGMELKFNLIKDISGELVFTTKQFTIQVFRARLTTTNQDFKYYVKGKKDPFDEGNDIDIYSIIKSVQTHYVNNKNEFEAVASDKEDVLLVLLLHLRSYKNMVAKCVTIVPHNLENELQQSS